MAVIRLSNRCYHLTSAPNLQASRRQLNLLADSGCCDHSHDPLVSIVIMTGAKKAVGWRGINPGKSSEGGRFGWWKGEINTGL